MSYDDFILKVAEYSSLMLAVFFFMIVFFNERISRVHALIIGTLSLIGFLLPSTTGNSIHEYVDKSETSMLLDGGTALLLTMFMLFDKRAAGQAVLLAFAVVCHVMVILHLTSDSSPFSYIYQWYDELIILIGFLQMAISYEGIIDAFSNLRKLLLWTFSSGHSVCKSLFAQKERATKT